MVSPDKIVAGKSVGEWISLYPVVDDICNLKETEWINPDKEPFEKAIAECPLSIADVEDASDRLSRFAPYIKAVFPETAASNGIIESDVLPIPAMQKVLERDEDFTL